MKFIFSLLIILSFISISFSQTSSSSTSSPSEECPTGYSGIDCSEFTQYADSYRAAAGYGGYVILFGNFGTVHDGLTVTIGGQTCSLNAISESMIQCYIGVLLEDTFHDINITQNGVSWYKPNFYRYQTNCVNGFTYSGYCQCYTGYIGDLCDIISPPYITSITSCSIDGGFITAQGWFGYDPTPSSISMFIGNKKVRISNVSSNGLYGVAPQGTGIQDITFYDSNNTLTTTVPNGFQYDPTLCFNDCFGGGECINGTCHCFFPFTGNYCFNTIDTSAPECCSCECSQN